MAHFDFDHFKVRKDGKALTKFDLACELEHYSKTPWDTNSIMTKIYEVFSYSELKLRLYYLLNTH